MAAAEPVRTAVDWPLRKRLAEPGVVTITDSAVMEWHGDGATVRDLLSGTDRRVNCDALVLDTPNVAETWLWHELADSGPEVHAVGDCVAPRRANNAIFEGRELGLRL